MLNYEILAKASPIYIKAFTGISKAEFEILLPVFQEALDDYAGKVFIEGKNRERNFGGGNNEILIKTEDKLLFILFYNKTYPLQTVIAFLFGISQGQACERIHRLSEILNAAFEKRGDLPARNQEDAEKAFETSAERQFIIDGTERPIQRPKNNKKEKSCYSGKSRRHTCKNNIIIDRQPVRVLYLSGTYDGSVADKKISDEESLSFPPGSILIQDKGFQGNAPEGAIVLQPEKKPKGKVLSAGKKQLNSLISKMRITVEHVIGGIKRSRIVKDVFRNTKDGFDDLAMENACGLYNFIISCRKAVTEWDAAAFI